MANPFVHMELNTTDLQKSKEFYGALFGWKFQDQDMGPGGVYSTFKPDDGPGGGIMAMQGAPVGWLAYIGVSDIRKATAQAKSLGAQVIRDSQEVAGHGWMSILTDPTGAPVALWQPKTA